MQGTHYLLIRKMERVLTVEDVNLKTAVYVVGDFVNVNAKPITKLRIKDIRRSTNMNGRPTIEITASTTSYIFFEMALKSNGQSSNGQSVLYVNKRDAMLAFRKGRLKYIHDLEGVVLTKQKELNSLNVDFNKNHDIV